MHYAYYMYVSKTISLREEACERLRAARRYPGESFSAVVLRAAWPETTTTGKAFLDRCKQRNGGRRSC